MFSITDGLKSKFTHSSSTLVTLAEKNPGKYLDKAIKTITSKNDVFTRATAKISTLSIAQMARKNKYNFLLQKLKEIKIQRISSIVTTLSELPLPDTTTTLRDVKSVVKNALTHQENLSTSTQKLTPRRKAQSEENIFENHYENIGSGRNEPDNSALKPGDKSKSEGNIPDLIGRKVYESCSHQNSVSSNTASTSGSINGEGNTSLPNDEHKYVNDSSQGSVPDISASTPESTIGEGDTPWQNLDTKHANSHHYVNDGVEGKNINPSTNERLLPKTAPKPAPKPDMGRLLHMLLGTSDMPNEAFGALKNSMNLVKVKDAMFSDVDAVKETLVHAPDGTSLHANEITVNGDKFAIATQFPTKTLMQSHLKMLAHNNTPILVVLASDADIDVNPKKTIPYFKNDGQYGNVNVKTKLLNEERITRALGAKQYLMTITCGKSDPVNVPVLHVTNWPDHKSIDSESLHLLDQRIDKILDENPTYQNVKMGLPVIHCRAGVGRTGQLLAVRAVNKQDIDFFTAVEDIRKSRSPLMVQMSAQLEGLSNYGKKYRIKLVN